MELPDTEIKTVDVLIVGSGPVGLVTAYQLCRFGGVSVHIIEKHEKSSQDNYGRAITLFPRSTEMLDQLGLAEELAQQCFACRSSVTYDKDGHRVHGRGWSFMENIKDTQWDFSLVLRQKYQEEIFREGLRRYSLAVHAPAELVAIEIDESLENNHSHRATATVLDNATGRNIVIKCKYLIGADGGRSFVRRAADIHFDGDSSEDKWVRIDGVVKTDMPNSRAYGAIESPTHGNVLWAPLDHGATRIGFAFTPERQKGYKEFNEAAAVKEAISSVKPFKLEFSQVDWWTVYSVGQRLARSFFTKGCIFLAGDACHTHSSGAAQGMNTGMHDAVNLAWKLSLVLRGIAKPSLLETYESERRPNVQKLIDYDKDIAVLMSCRLPDSWTGPRDADPNQVLGKLFDEAVGFNTGLGISFEQNILNREGSYPCHIRSGERAPDVKLLMPATFEPTRLHRVTPNRGMFWALVFAGDPKKTSSALPSLRKSTDASAILSNELLVGWLTIPAATGPSAIELLGTEPFGKVYYDLDGTAHKRYGVDTSQGAIVILRPDGWLGMAIVLDGSVIELEDYFHGIVRD